MLPFSFRFASFQPFLSFREDVDATNAALALAGMVNYFFLSSRATKDLVNHAPDHDEKLIQEYLSIFTRGISA
jgi:TetR/AcrR family transcriptional regulator